ncbi:dihydrodipicolinate synthase family protein [Microbacterium sp. NPDC058342]|uniref:dihydrodipicolinate synthase family protein n=1 Tax=Microbacterium sp. NPDC058342 TaxID=3346454 RepID=UPI00364DBA3C
MLRGVITPLVSPADAQDELDRSALAKEADRLLASGIDGLYLCGGTGDGSRLRRTEREHIAAEVVPRVRAAGGSAVVHVGQTFQRDAVALAEHAASVGADAVAAIPPNAAWPQVLDFYRALAATGVPVVVYYIPALGVTASFEQLADLLAIDGVAGIKMSDFNLFLMSRIKSAFPASCVFSGYDEVLVQGLSSGADGTIGTWSNLLPDFYAAAFAAVREGRFADADIARRRLDGFLRVGWEHGIIETFSELMHVAGHAQKCFRSPDRWRPGHLPADVSRRLLDEAAAMNARPFDIERSM